MFNGSPFNAAVFNGADVSDGHEAKGVANITVQVDDVYQGVAPLEIDVSSPTAVGIAQFQIDVHNPKAQGTAWLKITTYDTVKGTADLSIDVSVPNARGTAQLHVVVSGQAHGEASLMMQVIDETSPHWRVSVMLDGVDITSRVTGEPRVSESADSSGLMEFDMLPPAGPFDPLAWVGQSVTLDYVDCDEHGIERWRDRQYTGLVAEPTHNPDTGIVTITCTNDLQGRFMGMDRDAIAAVVGGRYSPHVFDEQADNWQYAQDRLSTRTAMMFIDQDGILRVNDWAARDTPDFTITDAGRIADSTRITRGDKSQLINTVRIDLDFRFERFKQRNVRYRFQLNKAVCEYLKATFPLPQKTMVQSAAESAGWEMLGGIAYTNPWPPGLYDCGRSPSGERDFRVWGYTGVAAGTHYTQDDDSIVNGLGMPDSTVNELCIGASWTLGKRWAQTVTETYSMTVTAPGSVIGNGYRSETQEYGIQAESDPDYWENNTSYRWWFTGSGATTNVGGAISKLPDGVVELSNGDWLYEASKAEKTGRAAMQEAQLCALDVARVDILNRHRQNRVQFSTVYRPGMRLGKTVRLVTPYVTATGVVVDLDRRFNTGNGSPTLDITLAVSRAGASGIVTETPLATLDAPSSDPLTEYDRLVYLPFRIGGHTTSPPFDETWDGVITNYDWDPTNTNPFSTDPNNPQTVIYPESVRVNTQEIGDADRQAVSAQAEQLFQIDIPNDELTEVA